MRASRAEIIGYLADCICSLYDENECRHIARMVASALSHEAESKYIIEPNEINEIEGIEKCAEELASGRPVQYVIGKAGFCGYDLPYAKAYCSLAPKPRSWLCGLWSAPKG